MFTNIATVLYYKQHVFVRSFDAAAVTLRELLEATPKLLYLGYLYIIVHARCNERKTLVLY